MSPREKHIPDDAQRTSVCFTAEERAAINWIREVRKRKKSRRTTTNDIVIDALWHYLEHAEGKTRQEIQAQVPATLPNQTLNIGKVTQMPKPGKKR
jgi:hypothetical protein